jgi:hypothetical protein
MVKWVARLAILAAFLGVVGTLCIIIYLNRHQNKESPQQQLKNQAPDEQTVDTLIPQPKQRPKLETEKPRPPGQLRAAETTAVKKQEDTPARPTIGLSNGAQKLAELRPTELQKKPSTNKNEVDSSAGRKQASLKHRKETLFNRKELQQIVVYINRVKEKNNIKANCVQIFSTSQTNNARKMSQVERYLKSHRFTIAGREIISKRVRGIHIVRSGECTRVILGVL